MGKEIPLQVHHINGNNTDNRVENLQILCPNCHAQTDTYCGKNKKQRIENDNYGFCKICGKPLRRGQKIYCSVECRSLGITKNNLTENELIDSFKTFGSFESVGKHFGVTGKSCCEMVKKIWIAYKKERT